MSQIEEFLFPRRLVSAPGAARRVGDLLSDRGGRGTVLVVTDAALAEAGLVDDVVQGLRDSGRTTEVFADIAGEPDAGVVERGVASASSVGATVFVGVGGGSALDVTKLIAYAAGSGVAPRDLAGAVPWVDDFPMLVLVPTTTGTGAEATRVAMFAVDGAKRAVLSPQLVPDIAVLDPELVRDLPAAIVAATSLDALSHAVESMMSTSSNDLTRQFSVRAARLVLARLRPALDGDPDARGDLLYAAFLAGVSLNAGVVLGHSLSYVLAARHGLPHGVGCSLALPYCLAYNQTMDRERADRLAADVLQREGARLRDLANQVDQLSRDAGLPTELVTMGSADDEPKVLADELVTRYPRPTNPVALESDRLAELIGHLRTGDLAGAWTAMGADA